MKSKDGVYSSGDDIISDQNILSPCLEMSKEKEKEQGNCNDPIKMDISTGLLAQEILFKNVDKMSHNELQYYIRLVNNKSECYITNEIFNWVSHLSGSIIFLLSTICLGCYSSYLQQSVLMTISCVTYGLLQTTMFISSSLHHGIGLGGYSYAVYVRLKCLDHISIFLSIAGSYFPILVMISPSWLGILLMCIVTLNGLCGIIIRCVFGMKVKMRAYIIMYVIMGWIGISGIYFIYKAVGWGSILLLLFMGVTYTVGAICYYKKVPTFKKGIFQSHEFWHVFVLIASIIHMVNVFVYIVPYGK